MKGEQLKLDLYLDRFKGSIYHQGITYHVQILGNLGGKSIGLENTDNLLSGHSVDLSNAVRITKDDTNLGGGKTLLGKLANMLLNIRGGDLAPAGWGAFVGFGTLRDTLSWCVHASHAVKGNGNNNMDRGEI